MSYFFVSVLQAFLPVGLLLGLHWAARPAPKIAWLMWITLLAVVFGTWLGANYPKSQQIQLALALAQIFSLLLFLLCQRWVNLRLEYLWQALLVFACASRWGGDTNLIQFTTTEVINTELLLHLAAIVIAFGWAVFCSVLLAMIVRQLMLLRWSLLLLLTVVLILPLSGDVLLLLIKLQLLELTKSLLSYIALVTNAHGGLNYFCALLLAVSAFCYFYPLVKCHSQLIHTKEAIDRRKVLAAYRNLRRVFGFVLLALLVVGLSQLYWDRIASQPPQLSEAIPVGLAADNQVHIPLEQVRDGKLHRFVWVAPDGKAVRFFVINRYPDRLRLSVVFDACLLCGDQGYVTEGNQVICVACGVHIFIPSIGKHGGCNPVPLTGWKHDDMELVISQSALEAGVNYFTTMVTLNVKDPVDGKSLTNVNAEYKYHYKGKTYFFTTEANYQRFREHPEHYVTIKSVEASDERESQ